MGAILEISNFNIFEWFAVMFPLVFSPGPANIIASISGGAVGIKRSVPLFAGINLIYISYSLIIGLGVGVFLLSQPIILVFLQYFGAAFIVWLGVKMWFRSKDRDKEIQLGFKEGIIIQSTNPKFPIILITMYSTFLNPADSPILQVVRLTISILLLNILTQFSWALAGKLLGNQLVSERANKNQDKFFSILLMLVGLWIVLRG